MEYIYTIPLGLSMVCAYTDLKTNFIFNKITFPMALLGLIYSALTGKIIMSLIGLAIGFGIFLIPVLMGGAGAGDAKMAGAIGAWLGLGILQVIFVASVIGLVWGSIRLQKAGMLKSRVTIFFRGIYYRFVYGMQGVIPMSTLPEDDNVSLPPEALPFGVCLALGAWVWIMILVFWRPVPILSL
ncbi:MAG: A24 family peptidase [Thermacetogeniaceae bacterium]|jgi:Flp pilus assembly protein protease CpaA